MKRSLYLSAGILALALTACQQESGGAPDQQNQAVNSAQDMTAGAATAASFISNAAVGGLYEVEAGRIAAQRGMDPRVKALGQTMVTDHTRAGDSLKPIAASANLAIPSSLDERRQGLIDNLRGASDADFDRVYLQQQEAAHNETVALLETYGQTGDNDALKAWAAQTLTVVRGHQRMVDALDEADVDTAR
ncbi:DUF4142 domain-containing protein [Brevundimonas sp. FT23042]|uniref:DUF4142 domain-containing protein n=1 Tax=Brevundimonas sp. FT23042 TaxID=3393749 RepID=UPI003B589F09